MRLRKSPEYAPPVTPPTAVKELPLALLVELEGELTVTVDVDVLLFVAP
jgi:hypothetical protein